MARRGKEPLALTDDLVESVAARVRAERFVPARALVAGKLSAGDAQLLAERLAARGLERTGRGVRVDLDAQIRETLERAGPSPLSGLARRVSGATALEVRRASARMLGAGELALVAAGRREVVELAGPHLLADDEVDALRALAADLAKVAASVRPRKAGPRRTLRREALGALRTALASLTSGSAPKSRDPEALLAALASLERERGRAVFIPELLRLSGADGDPAEAHEVLFGLARAGRVELRPESGVDNLADADRALCPADARGAVVSYVRSLPPAAS